MPRIWLVLLFTAVGAFADEPSTIDNASSCDIGVTPAATLLLPYFQVDTAALAGAGTNTLFTITNTSRYPQIAHVTLWTDWAYPVINFNVFLTGYDVQAINLYDVIVRGLTAPTSMSAPPGRNTDPDGPAPFGNASNPNFVKAGELSASSTCAALGTALPNELAILVKNALATGVGSALCGSTQVGFNHGPFAVGYATIDVVSYCTDKFPSADNGSYYLGGAAPILYDNVLIGDSQIVGPTPAGAGTSSEFDAVGSPMVHIRAIPEGGLSGAGGGFAVATRLPFTFYDRYTPEGARAMDRRQPLPSTWAARYVQGGVAGLATDLTIWRETLTRGPSTCRDAAINSMVAVTSVFRFDEHENSFGFGGFNCGFCIFTPPNASATSRLPTSSNILFPTLIGSDIAGWFYLNLSSQSQNVTFAGNVCRPTLSAQRAGFESSACSGTRGTTQTWVVSSMFGALGPNRVSTGMDAMWLGNGCTPAPPVNATIGPAARVNP